MVVRRVARLVLVALCAYVLIALFAFFIAERVIFQPPRPSYSRATLPVTHVAVARAESVAVLHLPLAGARYTILYSHGNAEDLGHVAPLLEGLRDLGFAVIGYDYRGYGLSAPGRPTVRKAVEDAEAVYRHAVDDLRIPPDRIILYGSSVGSGPSFELAVAHDPAGMILQGAFTSTYRVVTRVALFPFDRFRNLTRLRDVRCPMLVIHGTRDFVVPASHGRRLFAAAAVPKQALWVEDAGHNDLVHVAGRRYAEALGTFVELIEQNAIAK